MSDNVHTQLTVAGQQRTQQAIRGVGAALHGMGRSAMAANASMRTLTLGLNAVTAGFKIAAVGAGVLAGGIAGVGVASVRTLGNMQRLQLQLNTLYGSAREGKRAFDWLIAYDAKSPFNIADMVPLASALKAAGFNPMQDLPSLLDAVSAFGGSSDQALAVTRQLAQMISFGKTNMEDLRVITENMPGFQAVDLIRKRFNVPLGKDIGAMNIDPRAAANVILNEMDRRFGGASSRMAGTVPGLLSTLESSWLKLQTIIGQALLPAVLKLVNRVTAALEDPVVKQGMARLYSIFTAWFERTKLLEPESLRRALSFDWLFRLMERGVGAWFDMLRRMSAMQDTVSAGLDSIKSAFYKFEAGLFKIGAEIVGSIDGVQAAILEMVGKLSDLPILGGNGAEYRMRAMGIRTGGMAGPLRVMAGDAEARAAMYDPNRFINLLGRMGALGIRANAIEGSRQASLNGLGAFRNRVDMMARLATGDIQVPDGPLGRNGGRPEGSSAGRRFMALMDQIILWGGGDRARDTRTAMLGAYSRKPAPVKIQVQMLPASSKPMDVAMAKIAEEYTNLTLAEAFRSPAAVSQIRAALGLA